jgi:hypothetical protein
VPIDKRAAAVGWAIPPLHNGSNLPFAEEFSKFLFQTDGTSCEVVRNSGPPAPYVWNFDWSGRCSGALSGFLFSCFFRSGLPLLRSANHRSSVLMVRDLAIDGIFGSPLRYVGWILAWRKLPTDYIFCEE